MNGIFKKSTLIKIGKCKKWFLYSAVGLLAVGAVFGVIYLLSGRNSDEVQKILKTIGVLVLVLSVGVNNLIRMEKGSRAVQIIALIGLVAGLFAAVLGILMIWEVVPEMTYITRSDCDRHYQIINGHKVCYTGMIALGEPSIWLKILSILTSTAVVGFWISNVMIIKETMKAVKPLKIISMVCDVYCAINVVLLMCVRAFTTEPLSDSKVLRVAAVLFAIAMVAFVLTALAAWIMSKVAKTKGSARK